MDDRHPVRISCPPVAVLRPLAWTASLLLALGVLSLVTRTRLGHDTVFGLVPMLDLDREQVLPAFFATLLLGLASLALATTAAAHHTTRSAGAHGWSVLSFGLLLMAVDENLAVHEQFIDPLRGLLGAGPGGAFHFTWVTVAIPLVVIVGIALSQWLRHLDPRTRGGLLRAAAVYVAGTIGVELLGGMWASRHGTAGLGYGLIVVVEEGLEMAGTLLLLHATLDHLRARFGAVTLDLGPTRG